VICFDIYLNYKMGQKMDIEVPAEEIVNDEVFQRYMNKYGTAFGNY
jgi:hypothetical protein